MFKLIPDSDIVPTMSALEHLLSPVRVVLSQD